MEICPPPIVPSTGVFFVEVDGFVKVFDGLDVFAKLALGQAAIAPSFKVFFVKFDGFVQVFDGLNVLAMPAVGPAELLQTLAFSGSSLIASSIKCSNSGNLPA